MEDLLTQIAAKLGVEEGPVDGEAYEDEDIFGDEGEDDFGGEDDELPMESRRRRDC